MGDYCNYFEGYECVLPVGHEGQHSLGKHVVSEAQAVLGGRVFNVKACEHPNCSDGSHARLEAS